MSIRAYFGMALVALIFSFAGAAAWLMIALYLRQPLPWLAWPLGIALGWLLRQPTTSRKTAPWPPLLAGTATLLAAIYTQMMLVVISIAASMGLPLLGSMHTAGVDMLLALSWSTLSPFTMFCVLGGTLIAAWTAQITSGRA